MNRSFSNVLFGGFGQLAAGPAGKVEHAVGNEQARNGVDCRRGDGDKPQYLGERRRIRLSGDGDRADHDDRGDSIGQAHQRRVEQWRHTLDQLEA